MLEIRDAVASWTVSKYGAQVPGFGLAPMKVENGRASYDGGYIREWLKTYKKFEDLPKHTQEAVAILSMCDDNEYAKPVGRRVSRTVFWLDDNEPLLAEYKKEDLCEKIK